MLVDPENAAVDDELEDGIDLENLNDDDEEGEGDGGGEGEGEGGEEEESDIDKALKLLRDKKPEALATAPAPPAPPEGQRPAPPQHATYEDQIAYHLRSMAGEEDAIIADVRSKVPDLPAEEVDKIRQALRQPNITLEGLQGLRKSGAAVSQAKAIAYELVQDGKLKTGLPQRKANTPIQKGTPTGGGPAPRVDPRQLAQQTKIANAMGIPVEELQKSSYISKGKK